jgi:hypothetical protein
VSVVTDVGGIEVQGLAAKNGFRTDVWKRAREVDNEVPRVEILVIAWVDENIREGGCGVSDVGGFRNLVDDLADKTVDT